MKTAAIPPNPNPRDFDPLNPGESQRLREIHQIQSDIRACRACPKMVGRPVHGSAIVSRLFLLGQAPGPREESFGRPFAYTAGRTLFRWFEEASGVDETQFRAQVYMAAVGRCFPGKASAKGGGDRLPDPGEIQNCRRHIEREVAVLKPELILPVGKLAIQQVLGPELGRAPLVEVVGRTFKADYLGCSADVICLPHPSGLSAWHKVEPGKALLQKALRRIVAHPAWLAEFA